MKIGYACVPLTVDARTNRRLTVKNFSKEMFLQILEQNLKDLWIILENNDKYNIKLFRISSDIVPLGSHSINKVLWYEHFQKELYDIGDFIKDRGMRVSMHPGQYTVLNALKEDIVAKAIEDLEYHTRFLDSLGVDTTNKIILHIGGGYGDKSTSINRFIENFKRLPFSVKERLVIENDDKIFNINDVLFVSKEINIPVIFDNLHHECNHEQEITLKEIIKKVAKTWQKKDGFIKTHYSQQDSHKQKGSHSKTIIVENFIEYYEGVKEFNADIMLEVKDKDISAIKCNFIVNNINKKLKLGVIENQWAKYKYVLMERNYKYYKHCSKLVKENCTIEEFYEYTDSIINLDIDDGGFVNAAEHVWGYVKTNASCREQLHFKKLLLDIEHKDKVKLYLKKLCEKYNAEYIINSYYFNY